ncbi:P-loop containing nucleoside triphosphate hydrolase protein [Phialemonium atrogriseum]|uniref:P-loop containing nucleoside triphosphate hydrolase protein n=1 Tax=Phialemonium atrogriseum TaxID=1093897 RepID=A0AAJ0C3J0_9PEZI|nr:P-loop containing nucleoside triphosphate hydrolase protein [Phialemonium atrogriseum]KAK1769494.1 P-loop containing nucleoside triphosphate hydrolase protein [Phialemonium atrogriseum]
MGGINKPGKPKSKRTPVRLRHKIEKASAAKQRKSRKLAKKNPQWVSKLKKDPGIPNLFPYKDKLLQQIEDDRTRRKEESQRRKEVARAAKTGVQERTEDAAVEDDGEFENIEDGEAMDEDDSEVDDDSNPMAALLASARRAAKKYDRELQSGDDIDEDEDSESDSDESVVGVVEVTGGATSRKAYDKVFKQVVDQADVVLYVLDARDPEGTRSREVERSVMAAAGGGKRLILVLNKVDLVPPPVLRGWLNHLRRSFPTLPLRASGPAPNAQTFNHREMTVQSTSSALFRALKSFAASRNLKRAISVGVIGYPNVGKSSVINALMSRLGGSRNQHNACPAGAEAGVTTAIRSVKIDSKLTLLDSPGIVFPSTPASGSGASAVGVGGFVPKNQTEAHAHLVLLNAIPPKQIDDPIPAVTLLLKRLSTRPELMDHLAAVYDLPPLMPGKRGDPTTDFLVQVARRRGRLGRGGIPNINAAAMTVVTDWRDGRIQGWADAPPPPPEAGAEGSEAAPDQKEIVTEWAKEFKIEGLFGDDEGEAEVKDVEMQ